MQEQQCSFCIPLKFYYEETGRAHPKRYQAQATLQSQSKDPTPPKIKRDPKS